MRWLRGRWLVAPLVTVLVVALICVSLRLLARDRGGTFWASQSPFVVYFAGDSITDGLTATSWNAYRFRLEAYLRQNPGWEVSATGVWHGGWHASDALKALAVAPPRADTRLIVVEIGTNDTRSKANLATFTTDYSQMISQLLAKAPHARLLCLSAWWSPAEAQPYNAVIKEACSTNRYVDITTLFTNPSYKGPVGYPTFRGWATDSFHPNSAGHAAIARAIEAQMPLR